MSEVRRREEVRDRKGTRVLAFEREPREDRRGTSLEMREPYAMKVARTVLRGGKQP